MSILPRVLFAISGFVLNLIGRSLPSQVGRSHATWEPPGWS